MTEKKKKNIKSLGEIERTRIIALIGFAILVLLLSWQSDDAYHGYVMSKHFAAGDGLVYNAGERSTASTCPLFTIIISLVFCLTREMFFTSLIVCTIFSTAAAYILFYKFCRSREQIIISFLAMVGSVAFMSYTSSGLENCLLFFLSALFLVVLSEHETYKSRDLLKLAVILSGLAMARMDSVLIFIPVIVWIYLAKRDNVPFIQAVGIAILGLLPFILWEVFATFYYGFPFPNPAYVKLGTGIPELEYVKKGIWYIIYTFIRDQVVLLVPVASVILSTLLKRPRYIFLSSGLALYVLYIIRIGGDFMMGRHFTLIFFVGLCQFMILQNKESSYLERIRKYRNIFNMVVLGSVVSTLTFGAMLGSQYMLGHKYSSFISDEREYYSYWTGFYNNVVSLATTGRLCVSDGWNNEAPDELRQQGKTGGIVENAAGIVVYNNSDLYLNDTYCLGDPFLSKLPAKYDPNWRVGHLRRAVPEGYRESVQNNDNEIVDPDLHEYYDKIRLITRGHLFDPESIQTIIKMNTGQYDHLLKNYEKSLNE
ncbi:MAG: hypothetical protein K6F99_08435 [Lachnospiraceae bacterium]|nr:hypothetical protein [Lachnospiraceae bacterium]